MERVTGAVTEGPPADAAERARYAEKTEAVQAEIMGAARAPARASKTRRSRILRWDPQRLWRRGGGRCASGWAINTSVCRAFAGGQGVGPLTLGPAARRQ